MFKNILEIFYS